MHKILNKQIIAANVKRIDVLAPDIAAKIQPGQFIMVAPDENGERIPLPVVDSDFKKGSMGLIFQENSFWTRRLGQLQIDDEIPVVLGPLGVPIKILRLGTVVCIATGLGVLAILPVARALKKEGNKVIGILGAKNKKSLMLEPQMRLICNKLSVATEDGSYIKRGLATDCFQEVLKTEEIHGLFAAGSPEMMRAVAAVTREKKIKAWVMLNPVMLDGTGLCGSCRVTVGGRSLLACVEGPVFDAQEVDYEDLKIRMKAY